MSKNTTYSVPQGRPMQALSGFGLWSQGFAGSIASAARWPHFAHGKDIRFQFRESSFTVANGTLRGDRTYNNTGAAICLTQNSNWRQKCPASKFSSPLVWLHWLQHVLSKKKKLWLSPWLWKSQPCPRCNTSFGGQAFGPVRQYPFLSPGEAIC